MILDQKISTLLVISPHALLKPYAYISSTTLKNLKSDLKITDEIRV